MPSSIGSHLLTTHPPSSANRPVREFQFGFTLLHIQVRCKMLWKPPWARPVLGSKAETRSSWACRSKTLKRDKLQSIVQTEGILSQASRTFCSLTLPIHKIHLSRTQPGHPIGQGSGRTKPCLKQLQRIETEYPKQRPFLKNFKPCPSSPLQDSQNPQ